VLGRGRGASRGGRLALVLVLLSVLLALPASARGEGETPSACQAVTPADAPFGCIEVIPLGASASVTFDGVDLGLSPLGIPNVEPGDHTLRLDRTGDYPWYGTISVAPGQVIRVDPPLAPMVGIFPFEFFHEVWPLAVMVENHPDARPPAGRRPTSSGRCAARATTSCTSPPSTTPRSSTSAPARSAMPR
jgi:hypothetical protein